MITFRTFTTTYRSLAEFDDFLNSIVRDGYTPYFMREQNQWHPTFGQRTQCAITAYKGTPDEPVDRLAEKYQKLTQGQS